MNKHIVKTYIVRCVGPPVGALTRKRCFRDCSGVLVVASLKETRWGTLVGSRALVVASLKETWGLLSRFDCVYSDYITQGCPGGALAVAMSLRARCAFFPTHCPSKSGLMNKHIVEHIVKPPIIKG